MRIPSLLVLAALGVVAAADEPDPKAIDALVGKLASERESERADALAKLRAQRHAALPQLARHLETASDPELQRQLRAVLAPAHLEPKGEPALAAQLGLVDALERTLDAYLGADADARKRAEEKLARVAPYAAVVVELRLAKEEDAARRVRLRIAYYRLLEDTPARAKLVLEAAQGLETVANNHGPFKEKWQSEEVRRLRMKGKLLHWCFVDPGCYGKQLTKSPGMYMPYKDLPAAADLYRLAGWMYHALATAEKDEKKAAELEANAALAARAAEQCERSGARTKG